jgi:hypothetical protein
MQQGSLLLRWRFIPSREARKFISTANLPAGNHQVSVRLVGYQEWVRDLRVLSGSEINLEAKLQKD